MKKKTRRLDVLSDDYFPAYVVWELTLDCDHACTHCGSRAARPRDNELSVEEALDVVGQLATMRAREVVLIGGEAYLHPGFLDIVRALKAAGIRPSMTTGGLGITPELAENMARAGMHQVSVSIDGLRPTHDRMRARKGSFDGTTRALAALKAAGIRICANTNINRLNAGDLEGLYEHLVEQGVTLWQIQITAALGRAADRPAMLLQPWELADVMPRIAALKQRGLAARSPDNPGLTILPGNNLGYFGPEEALLRSPKAGGRDHWAGCQAGRYVMGIESNGAVKGCPSLQASYIAGNLRQRSLSRLWRRSPEIAFTRKRTVDDLWGFCRTCPYAATCMAGCSFTAHALFGRPGNNPYCHFRVKTLAGRGIRERLVPVAHAPGQPFDHGRFEIVEEAVDAPEPAPMEPGELVAIRIPRRRRRPLPDPQARERAVTDHSATDSLLVRA